MRMHAWTLIAACPFLWLCLPAAGQTSGSYAPSHPAAVAQDKEDKEDKDDPAVILEVGAAANWNFRGGATTFAPNLAAECTPIENWLELEAGVSPFFTRKSTEWDTDLLFKKPWTLSPKAEFMLGVGPEWVHSSEYGVRANSLSAEAVVDAVACADRRRVRALGRSPRCRLG